MKKKKYSYFVIYLFLIILLFLVLYFFINDNNKNNTLTKHVKDLSASISKVIYYPLYKSSGKESVESGENEVLRKEVDELKKELDLKKSLTDKTVINANTIKRSTSYWYNILTLDKGKKDGIKKGNIVMNSYGVIGNVIKVNNHSCDVKLLTSKNKNNYISAMFLYNDNYYYGLIDSYNITKNELHLKNVVGDFDNLKDIDVVTSGLSKNNVKGLLIGKIKRSKKTNYGISNDIYITPSANFNNITVVSVLVN